ncbi:hypothetical protein NLU13_3003 [Sarocladium strictum]|uniref:Uncharacterized protein n=1 Tax=Sarocladium strictum TaxID=5046 RepID=A0AA39GMM5_SARSR|nr:hypothetical protein NLU13_3003 [Sarocladium strictum]
MAPETPKGVSSRLLTMKFMQRAAASGSSAGTPESASQSSKKRKLDHSSGSGRLSLNIDQAAVQAAIHEQQATRQAALDRHVTGDTHWVLNTSLDQTKPKAGNAAPLKIKYIGYGDVDSGEESGDQEDEAQMGRTSTSNYKQAKSKKQKIDVTDGDDGSQSESDLSNSETSPARRSSAQGSQPSSRNASRSRSHSRHRSENAKAKELRDKRKKKDVPLSKLTSISSGGNRNFSSQSGKGSSRSRRNS